MFIQLSGVKIPLYKRELLLISGILPKQGKLLRAGYRAFMFQ
jgi:hypothetical protein